MRSLPVGCILFIAGLTGPASGEPLVRLQPSHPLADAMGYVLSTMEVLSPVDDAVSAGGRTPAGEAHGHAERVPPVPLPGWPIDLDRNAPTDGGLFVQADDDPEPEILFNTGKNSQWIYLMNVDGTHLPGWPIRPPTRGYRLYGPSFGDLDGDGDGEVVFCSGMEPNGFSGSIHAYHTDGTPVTGFPYFFGGDTGTPVVADLDGDGTGEIITGERRYPVGSIHVIGGNGQALPGWPIEIDHVPATTAGTADLDGDGALEILFASFTSLYAFTIEGSIVPGFPFMPPNNDNFSGSSPVSADVDGDGLAEIAIGTHNFNTSVAPRGYVYLLHPDGQTFAGWPRSATYWVFTPPTFADLDQDGDLEVIAGDQVLSPAPINSAYAWHVNGSNLAGWPVTRIYAIHAQIAVGDTDGDDDAELIWDDNTMTGELGRLMGYNHDGTPIDGWPVETLGTTFQNTPALVDVDLDGDLELLAMSGSAIAPTMTAYLWDLPGAGGPATAQMPMNRYGPGRDGRYRPAREALAVNGAPSGPPAGDISIAPNPGGPPWVIEVRLREAGRVRLTLHDVQGRLVRTIRDAVQPSGSVRFTWQDIDSGVPVVGAGLYLLRLEAGSQRATRKVLIQR